MNADLTDGDTEVSWALGATLPPTHPAPAWRLLHPVAEWKRAKKPKKGTWTVSCPCECEVCIVFYPVFARSSRERRAKVATVCFAFEYAHSGICGEVCANFAGISREYLNLIHFPFHLLLRRHGTARCPPPTSRGRQEALPPGRAHRCPYTAWHGHKHGQGRPRVLRRALEFGRRPAR